MRELSRTITGMERSGIREIFDLANTIPTAIHLEMGEPDFETPRHIREAAARAAEDGYTRYTPNAGIQELREAVARKVRKRNGIEATADQVIVTPGAIAAIYGVIHALCDPDDEILIPDPAWPNYRMQAHLQGVSALRYPVRAQHGMQPRAEDIERHIGERTRLLLINSPSNPTGAIIDRRNLDEILELAARNDLWVLSDEVYDEMVFDGLTAPSAASGLHAERVISVFSFSKTYAMTGWRVGYAVAPAAIAPMVVKTQEPTTSCVNAPAQMAALAALEGPQECVEEMRRAYETRRDEVVGLLRHGSIPHSDPQGAFYLWLDISDAGIGDVEFARRLLVEREVAVTPGSAFGPASGDYVRVSLASSSSDLREGVTRLVDAVREWGD